MRSGVRIVKVGSKRGKRDSDSSREPGEPPGGLTLYLSGLSPICEI